MAACWASRSASRPNCHGASTVKQATTKPITATDSASQAGRKRNRTPPPYSPQPVARPSGPTAADGRRANPVVRSRGGGEAAPVRDPRTLPKAHLHVHLESTIRPATAAGIAAGNGLDLPPAPAPFAGFAAFAEHGGAVRDLLRRPADFRRIAREFCHDQAADGVRYAEVTFTAAAHGERLGDPRMPLEAVLAGLAEGAAATGIGYGVIL